MKNHALEHFRRPPMLLNCAQSVLYAYQKVYGNNALSLSDMKAFGGGRAPGGLCGALHAACTLAPEKAEQLKSRFAETTGSVFCKDLRRADQHPCAVCVSEAAQLLENVLGSN
ncbi:MAG TPA: C-GCAxxG-C-C family (seleno)protein, partial [Clostridia bacterium]|nr:C-GCAxxG-C-C family (seleno)protein [Clostridia bacterium]